jgi:hypothetical protein
MFLLLKFTKMKSLKVTFYALSLLAVVMTAKAQLIGGGLNSAAVFAEEKNNAAIPMLQTATNLLPVPIADTFNSSAIYIIDSVQYFKKYNGDKQLVFVKDSLRGGFFYKYAGSKPADNGVVFLDLLGRKWHRYMTNDYINVCWYGLKAADEAFDNFSAWTSMMNSFKKIRVEQGYDYYSWKGELVFPPNEKSYFFSQTLIIDYNMVIRGGTAAQKYRQFSKLKFPANTMGINLRFPDNGISGVSGTLIKDLQIAATPVIKNFDSTKHGINSNAPVFIENVMVTGFSGHGINLQGPQGTPLVGSVDLSSVKRCYLVYNYDGLHLEGGDGNACLVEECNLSLNRRWGLNDMSFLGNTYIANHAASNCSVTGQRTLVCQGGHVYAAQRAGSNLKNPGVDAGWKDDWFDFGAIGCIWAGAGSFKPGNFYEPGGPYSIDNRFIGNQNQRSLLIGCYAEVDQPPSYLGNKSLSIGGINGSGFSPSSPVINAESNMIYLNKYGIRSASGDDKIFGLINQLGVTVQKENGEGLRMTYDTNARMGKFLDQSTGASNTFITSGYVNPAFTNRASIAPGRLLNFRGVYFVHSNDRGRAKLLDIANKKPASAADAEIGDINLATPTGAADFEPADDAIYKVIAPSGDPSSKVWTVVKGYSEHLKTTADATAANIETTFYVNRSMKLYVSGSCTDKAGNYYFFKKLFRIISNGSIASLVSVENLENEEKSKGFANATINLKFSGVNVTSVVQGVAGNWQLFISREKQ